MEAFTLEAFLKLNTDGFDSSLAAVEGSLKSEKSLTGFAAWGTAIGNVASKAFSKAFTAGVEFAKDVVNKTMNFESAMSAVESVTQASDSEMSQLTAKARELGGSTVYTAEQVAQAMFYMGQAGWSTEQILSGISGVMDLAAASGDDLSRVSDIVTDSITNFGLTADDTTHYVDVLAQTARNSNTNISMMGDAFKYVSPVAKALNYSIEDVGLALGLAANNGIKASQAGTSLRMILSNMIDPSDDAAKALNKMGVSIDDGTGKIKPFVDVMGDFRRAMKEAGYDPTQGRTIEEIAAAEEKYAAAVEKANELQEKGTITKKMADQQRRQALDEYTSYVHFNQDFLKGVTDVAGLRGLSTLLAIMNASADDYSRVQQQIAEADGAAAQMAETRRDNLQGDITLLNSAVDDFQLTLGQTVKDPLRDMVQGATKVVNELNGYMTAGQGKLNADQMLRVMEKFEDWDKTPFYQFFAKNNKATDLYRTVADELEAAGASEQEIQNVIDKMLTMGNPGELLNFLNTLRDTESEVTTLGEKVKDVEGDYDINYHINTFGEIPNPQGTFTDTEGTVHPDPMGVFKQNAKGNWDVPYDNYAALLHRNEMVLTATQARQYREGRGNSLDAATLAQAMRSAVLDLTMELNGEAVGRVFGDQTTRRVNHNISQINRRHRYGYGG